ncbi:amino acid ABC transporter permease [Bradyrhizobium sp. UFLA05-109]
MNYKWNWGIFWELSPEGGQTYFDTFLAGTTWTLSTAVCAWLLALTLGSLVGVARTLKSPTLVKFGNAYVELFRNIPLLVQIFLWYFIMPELLPTSWGNWVKGLVNAPFYCAVLGIGFYMSSRVSEQVRAGIMTLPRGQSMAAMALGLTTFEAYRYVLLPMAYRIILPPLSSEFLNTIKNTSVALTVGLLELTARAHAMQEFSFQVFEAFTAAAAIYLTINAVVVLAMRILEGRLAIPGFNSPR